MQSAEGRKNMKRILLAMYHIMVMCGLDPRQVINSCRGLPGYLRDWIQFRRQHAATPQRFTLGPPYPCLADRFAESGTARGHYFHQDLLVARRIFTNNPQIHVDVGSSVEGLVAHVASYRPIQVIDIRPLSSSIPNVQFVQMDMMGKINRGWVNGCDSLSCLHALEHFGLGRYGDPVRYDGHLVGWDNLHQLLKPKGKLYFSVPIGRQRIEFNAHRIFSLAYLRELIKGKYQLDCFSYVDDKGDLHENAGLTDETIANNYGCSYGCGIFEMTKR
jgi:hypothetical protein